MGPAAVPRLRRWTTWWPTSFAPPPAWSEGFDLVLEAYTLQVLPADLRPVAARQIADMVAPGGTLLVIARGRGEGEDRERCRGH